MPDRMGAEPGVHDVDQPGALVGHRNVGRHRIGVIQSGLQAMERGRADEDLPFLLKSLDAPGGEGIAVTHGLHIEAHVIVGSARAKEVGVQGVRHPVVGHCLIGGGERLRQHLPAVGALHPGPRMGGHEGHLAEAGQIKQGKQFCSVSGHSPTLPHRRPPWNSLTNETGDATAPRFRKRHRRAAQIQFGSDSAESDRCCLVTDP
ncbi:hypothetical protein SDC9_144907 [bioreactor metagenome]|uniref:Uncharacterized protein n=1 Tax=bioreactor metagenome TaxID=1076179 RepID=A0A645E7L0_9ZZZZ